MRAELIWSEEAVDHVWERHRLDVLDVEEAYYDSRAKIRKAREGRQIIYGRTGAGRYLFIVVKPVIGGISRLITARPMDPREKRFYHRK